MEMTAGIRVDVSADLAWELLGTRFGDIAEWAGPITASVLDQDTAGAGAVRTCKVAGFGPMGRLVVRERLLAYDASVRSLTYEAVDEMSAFVRRATNRWTVEPDGVDRCVVRTSATLIVTWWLRLLGPLVARRLHREAALVLEELRHRLETGRPHARASAS